jgi:hypothetical protein
MKTRFFTLLIAVALVFAFGCNGNSDKNNKNNDIEVDNQVEKLVYPLPTPFEVTQMLQASGTAYNIGLINDLDKTDQYTTEKSQALNLGVYGADLAYAATYNQAQATRDILAVTKKLSDQLGLTDVLDKNIVERIEQNIENGDSLYKIINNSYYDTFDKLNNQSKGAVAMLVITGAWIESVYIATQLAITSQDKTILMNQIAEQKFNLNALIPLLQQYKDDNADVAEILPDVEKFKEFFDKVQTDEDSNVSIDEDTFNALTDYTAQIRQKIVDLK